MNASSGNNRTGPTTWVLRGYEEDKNDNLGTGNEFNFTLGWSGDDTRVINVRANWASGKLNTANPKLETESGSDIYVDWILSDLATKLTHSRQSGNDAQHSAEIEYHGGESFGAFFLAAENANVDSTSSVSSGSAISSLGNVIIMDSEVSGSSNKNLIVVGGSCINSAAATLLGGAHCGASFTEATGVGSGQFLIESFAGAYTPGKIALLVAGYAVGDTQNAAEFLTKQTVDTVGGTKYIGTSATNAEMQVTA